MGARFGVHDQAPASGLDIPRRQDIGSENHEVSLERFVGMAAGGGNDVGPEGEIGNELSVHHIPLEKIDASCIQGFDLGTQFGKVAGENRRSYLNREGHSPTLPGGRSLDFDVTAYALLSSGAD